MTDTDEAVERAALAIVQEVHGGNWTGSVVPPWYHDQARAALAAARDGGEVGRDNRPPLNYANVCALLRKAEAENERLRAVADVAEEVESWANNSLVYGEWPVEVVELAEALAALHADKEGEK